MADTKVMSKQFKNWIPVREALSRVEAGVGKVAARRAILERLKAGVLRSACKEVVDVIGDDAPISRGIRTIGARAWNHLQGEDFWQTETAKFFERKFGIGETDRTILCFNVRFEPAGIREMIPRQPQMRSGPHEGGRPRKDYWDDLWIELCRQLDGGLLKPKQQSDIEKAMLAWASRHRHAMSVTSARTRARRLFAALKKMDKN